MIGKKNNPYKVNENLTTIAAFLESFNKTAPSGFPRATLASLKQFQALHPGLFKNKEEWSIDKHRKKVMDWLPAPPPDISMID